MASADRCCLRHRTRDAISTEVALLDISLPVMDGYQPILAEKDGRS